MMNNLFSMFDPSMAIKHSMWLMMLIPMWFLMPKMNKNQKLNSLIIMMINPMKKELKPLLSNHNKKGLMMIMMTTFTAIIMMNLIALLPFNFTPTAHMMISFSSALLMWTSMMMFGWYNSTNNMMAHMVPTGTPFALLNFMVMIEMTSNMIRPLTLAIRLSANMVAGHLLLSLLSNFFLMSKTNMMIASPILLILSILEMAVAMIQGYVFMTLLTLYSTEIHYVQ